jgi:hypothetical protein
MSGCFRPARSDAVDRSWFFQQLARKCWVALGAYRLMTEGGSTPVA